MPGSAESLSLASKFPEALAVPAPASFSLAVSRASVAGAAVAEALDASQPAAECAAAFAGAEVRVSVAPLVDDSLPVGRLVELPTDDLARDDCSAVPLADDSPRAGSVDSARDDCSVVPLADDSPRAGSVDSARDDCSVAPLADDSPRAGSVDSARDDYLVALSADGSPPVDSADSAGDDSAAPDSSCQDAHWVLAGCPDDSPADLQAVDSLAYQVWHSADFRADQVC